MVLNSAKNIAKKAGIDTRRVYQALMVKSIRSAIKEQSLEELVEKCRKVIPDISQQYTGSFSREEYERFWEVKMRGLHAFQVKVTLDAIEHLNLNKAVIADIGDSSGNHGLYFKALAGHEKISRVISVNLDPVAVEKVKKNGGEAILSRAEDLDLNGQKIDLFTSFEMLEHLMDPVRFLHQLAEKGPCDYFLMSVPYRRTSQVGFQDLRKNNTPDVLTAEKVHIFELCPEDWKLMAEFAGWKTVFTKTYVQYPRYSPLRVTSAIWRAYDFEGFHAVLFKRDLTISRRYADW